MTAAQESKEEAWEEDEEEAAPQATEGFCTIAFRATRPFLNVFSSFLLVVFIGDYKTHNLCKGSKNS